MRDVDGSGDAGPESLEHDGVEVSVPKYQDALRYDKAGQLPRAGQQIKEGPLLLTHCCRGEESDAQSLGS
jgi:hypothetical protein